MPQNISTTEASWFTQTRNISRRVRFPLLMLTIALLIVGEVLLHLPPRSLPRIGLDKMAHVICYGGFTGMTLLTLSVFVGWSNLWRSTQGLAAVAVTLFTLSLLGYVDEITQPLTGRRFEWSDLAADVVGILACGLLFGLLGRLVTKPAVAEA